MGKKTPKRKADVRPDAIFQTEKGTYVLEFKYTPSNDTDVATVDMGSLEEEYVKKFFNSFTVPVREPKKIELKFKITEAGGTISPDALKLARNNVLHSST